MPVPSYQDVITVEPGRRGGRPTIRGSRITVGDVLGWLAAGMSPDEIVADFPELTEADVRAALAYATDQERRTRCASALILGSVFAVFISLPVVAAEITTSQPFDSEQVTIQITGPIKDGDDLRFADAVEPYEGALGLVVLDSPGGSLQAGLSIGAQIHELRFDTIVGAAHECYSACALIWLSGAQRNLSVASIIGVHAAYTLDETGQPWTSGSANASLGGFLNEIGIPEPAIRYITEAGANDILPITPEIARRLGIDVWEHRDDRVITPFEEPTAYAFARQTAELIGMSQECAILFGLDSAVLEEMGQQRLSEGHNQFGGEIYSDLVPLASDLVKSGREQQGFRSWCLRTEAQLRYEGLPIGIGSPSFDCVRASTDTEETICASPDLWTLDRTLATLYALFREEGNSDTFAIIRKDQIDWIERRNRCGSDPDCLARSYWLRITEIGL